MNIKDFKWTEKRFGTTFANILKKLGGLSKDGTDGSIEYKDDQGNVTKLVTDSNFSSLLAKNGLIEVTWQELKDKRDNRQLIPGTLYRITDYNCTTTQENTQSAGHQFDIVLLALSESKLAEEGWAMRHENDTYFANSNLSAWKVWYCLDNDKSRFAWADDSVDESIPASITINGVKYNRNPQEDELAGIHPYAWKADTAGKVFTNEEEPSGYPSNAYNKSTGGKGTKSYTIGLYTRGHEGTNLPNGRGVIYRLVDEWNNDVPYDFKNIQFVRKLTDGEYDADNGTDTWVYTFNLWYNNACEDASVKIGNKQCATYNIITSLLSEDNDIFVLSNSVCLGFVNNRGKYCTSKNVRIHNSEECTLGYAADVSIDASASIHIKSGGIYCIMCSDSSYDVEGIYILNKKVLTES